MNHRGVLFGMMLCVLAHATPALAQRAGVRGTVVDATGAALTGVSLTLVSLTQGIKRTTQSDHRGDFSIPLVAPGRYRLTAQLAGFAPHETSDLLLAVGEELLLTVRMQVAPVSEAIVIEVPPGRAATESSVGTVIDRALVENLPLNGRSFQSLISLTPGVVFTRASFTEPGQFSVNGQRPNANYFSVDGVSANIGISTALTPGQAAGGSLPGLATSGGTNNLVSLDALEEFRVETSTFAPEFGRTPGAQVSALTRAGTNQLRGVAFDYVRDDGLDATDWFANRSNLSKPPLRHHNFGGVIGGPLRRDNAFFFGAFERLRLRLPQTRTVEVPSMATRDSASPAVRPFLDALPVPNGAVTATGGALFSASWADQTSVDSASLRLDHTLGRRTTLFGRYNYAPSETERRTRALSTLERTDLDTHTLTVGASVTISPRLLIDLRINHSGTQAETNYALDDFGGALGLSESATFPSGLTREDALFTLALPYQGLALGRNVDNRQRQLNVVSSAVAILGNHQIKTGVDYRRLTPRIGPRPFSQQDTFSRASLASGVATNVFVQAYTPMSLLFANTAAFVQDAWRVTDAITLTYGVRWDVNPAPSTRHGETLYTVSGSDDPATMQLIEASDGLYETQWANIAPRVGVSWRLGQDTVLRGGAGIFYDLGSGVVGEVATSFPYARSRTLANVALPIAPALLETPPFTIAPPVTSLAVPDPSLETPRVYQWNAAIERRFGIGTFSATYVGAVGRDLLRTENLRNPNPTFEQVRLTSNDATSDYHGLQLQFQRRLSRGVHALASYSFGRSHDIASSDATLLPRADRLDPQTDRGPSDFDIRHAFSGAVTWMLPHVSQGWIAALTRGWSIDAVGFARSAPPLNVFYRRNLGFGLIALRPDLVPGAPIYIESDDEPGGWRLNPAAFSMPVEARQGNLARNALRGFSAWQLDLSARRRLPLGASRQLELRAELFNVFNHPNFSDPETDLTSGAFGRSPSMLSRSLGSGTDGLNPLYQVGAPRSVQLAARFSF